MVRQLKRFGVGAVLLATSASVQAQTSLEPRELRRSPLGLPFQGVCVTRPADSTQTGDKPQEPAHLAADAVVRADPLGALNKYFHEGGWDTVQKAAKIILDEARCRTSGSDAAAYDYRRGFVWLTWIGVDTFDTHGVHRVLVHVPAGLPYKLDLPGVTTFYEVFASSSDKAELTAAMVSTEKPNETLAQIPSVVEKIVPALFGLAAATLPKPMAKPEAEAPPPSKIWVMPFQIDLPAKRASVAVTSVAAEPIPVDAFNESASRLSLRTSFQTSECGRALAIAQGVAAEESRNDVACSAAGSRKSCLDVFDTKLRAAFKQQMSKKECAADGEKKALATVDEAFRSLTMTGMAREVKSDFTFSNKPLQRVSFGLVEAVAFYADVKDPRVKLDDDGRLQSDPLPRLLTIVTVNSSFKPYDSGTLAATEPEKWRWFAGGVILPDFGIAGGLSYLPIRGIAVNVGFGRLFLKSADRAGIGSVPTEPTDPFEIGKAWVGFLGVGYNFK